VASARAAAERAVTLVRDSARLLPLGQLPRDARVLSISFARRPDLGAGVAFNAEMRARFSALRAEWIDADEAPTKLERLQRAADSAEVVIVGSYIGASSTASTASVPMAFAEFVRALGARGKRPIVVAFGNPYLLQQMPEVATYVVAWGVLPLSQQAAARALLGTIPIGGRLPIAIPPLVAAGSGEMRERVTSARE
jgi:beta-N-acetylhexosaminidase